MGWRARLPCQLPPHLASVKPRAWARSSTAQSGTDGPRSSSRTCDQENALVQSRHFEATWLSAFNMPVNHHQSETLKKSAEPDPPRLRCAPLVKKIWRGRATVSVCYLGPYSEPPRLATMPKISSSPYPSSLLLFVVRKKLKSGACGFNVDTSSLIQNLDPRFDRRHVGTPA